MNSWEVICAAIDKSIHSYDLGAAAINLHTHTKLANVSLCFYKEDNSVVYVLFCALEFGSYHM